MNLEADGRPLHTRSLTVVLRHGEDGKLHARGDVIDLRKSGFVPMVHEIQTAGIIHQMSLDALVDPATRVLERLEAAQPSVAFEPSASTRGDSCRDPAGRLQSLVGRRFDADFPAELSAAFGGPRGCSHLLTLFHVMASALPRALDLEQARGWGPAHRRRDETLFRRALFVDGLQPAPDRLQLLVQLGDFHATPLDAVGERIEQLADQAEVRAVATVTLANVSIAELRAAERRRTRETLASAGWRDRSDALADLVGRPIMPGLGAELRRRFGSEPGDRLLLDALVQLAPGFVQCTPAMTDDLVSTLGAGRKGPVRANLPDFLALGGATNSCYMWREGGPLLGRRARAAETEVLSRAPGA